MALCSYDFNRALHDPWAFDANPSRTLSLRLPSAVTIDSDAGVLRTGVGIFRPSLALGY